MQLLCTKRLQRKHGPQEELISVEEIGAKTDQMLKQIIPWCPICETDTSVKLYGWQQYLISEGQVQSMIYRCKSCDFNFRRFDQPFAEVLSHFQVAPYSTDEIEQRWLRRREGFYWFLLDLLSKPADGKSILDIGCAFGHFLDCAVERGYQPFGTEASEEMADLPRKRRDYRISSRPLNDLQLPEKQFDVITFVDSFYYFENPLETLQQCYMLLKPGGELLMRVTNRNQMAKFYQLVRTLALRSGTVPEMPFWTTDDAISCHSRRSLAKLMDKTGFRIIKLNSLEKGKKIESFLLRTFYQLTGALALVTCERICLTPGIVCLAAKD